MSKEQLEKSVDEIMSKLDDEKKSEVSGLLKSIKSIYKDDVDSLYGESKRRQEKITELEPKLQTYEDEIEQLKRKADTTVMEQELTDLRKYKTAVLKQNKETFITKFSGITQHDNFEKAKDKFTLPEADEEGKYDFSKLDDDVIQKNSETLTFLESLDFFKTKDTKPVVTDGQRFKQISDDKRKPVKSRSELFRNIKDELKK